jgi:hypothetical protein
MNNRDFKKHVVLRALLGYVPVMHINGKEIPRTFEIYYDSPTLTIMLDPSKKDKVSKGYSFTDESLEQANVFGNKIIIDNCLIEIFDRDWIEKPVDIPIMIDVT